MGTIRVLKQVKCIKCDKIGVYCKSLCPTCYRNKTRHTPEGKLKVKLYNDKVQREKLLNRKPKEIKLCECGKIVVAKNLCRNCYQNIRNKENYISKPRLRKPRQKKLVDNPEKFDLSIKIGNKNTGKYFQKARVGQSKTKQFVMQEITEYLKYDEDFGDCNYLSIENKILHLEDYFDCKPMYIDMNKIYKH
jgi:hypothetical protein